MKTRKRIISAVLSAAIAGGVLAANSASFCLTASAMTNTKFYTQQQFESNWYSLIQQEKQKYPEKVNGQQCYWNGSDPNSYTQTPCLHNGGYNFMMCMHISVPFTQYESTTYKSFREVDLQNRPKEYSQCIAFAAKLQEDIFQTGDIIRYDMVNGQYQDLDGNWHTYYPKNGDSVRIDNHHSIFITNANYSGVTFAQCNANDQCEIDWDATQYENQTVNAAYLRQHASYVERPALCGDLNLDGNINSRDAAIFAETMMTNGGRIGNTPDSAFDANNDLRIDEQDYNRILHMSGSAFQSTRYVNGRRGVCTKRWNKVWESEGDFCVNGGIYATRCNTEGGVSFIGVLDSNLTSFSVPSQVTNPANGQTYTVTEIGYASSKAPCTGCMQNLRTVSVPNTVRKIAEKAFYSTNLKSITFTTDSQLYKIDNYAFYNTALTSITLPSSLKTISPNAFHSCAQLGSVVIRANSVNDCSLQQIGDNAFQGCTALDYFRIPNNTVYAIKFGTTTGVFDTNASLRLELPNTSSTQGVLYLQTADANKFRNSSLRIYAGNYRIREYNGSSYVRQLVSKSNKALEWVYPS